jgi:hypothetical protein
MQDAASDIAEQHLDLNMDMKFKTMDAGPRKDQSLINPMPTMKLNLGIQ